MNELIRTHSTGKPKQFTSIIGICERTFFDYLSNLKEIVGKCEVSILYNDIHKAYEDKHSGRLENKDYRKKNE